MTGPTRDVLVGAVLAFLAGSLVSTAAILFDGWARWVAVVGGTGGLYYAVRGLQHTVLAAFHWGRADAIGQIAETAARMHTETEGDEDP